MPRIPRVIVAGALCFSLIACTAQGSAIVPTGATKQPHYLQVIPGDPFDGGGGSTGAPDSSGELSCSNNGGIFMDLIGGSGVSCAGEPGGPSDISGGVPQCKIVQWHLWKDGSGNHGSITWSDGSYASFDMGAEINVDDCTWSAFRT